MREKVKTLVIISNGEWWSAILGDTIVRGMLGIHSDYGDLPPFLRNRLAKKLLQTRYDALSYVYDWLDALQHNTELDITIVNLTNLLDLFQNRRALKEFPLVIIMHSAIGDSMRLIEKTRSLLQNRRGQLVSFIGNEYLDMPEKIQFLQDVQADYICSQLPLASARRLYSDCTDSEILAMPHALNQRLYQPGNQDRTIDIGFRGANYPLFIGDTERNNFTKYIENNLTKYGLIGDFCYKTVGRKEWTKLLQSCSGTIGAESGSYFLDDQAKSITAAREYQIKHPNTSFSDLYQLIFGTLTNFYSGKCISSRHFEAIGTQTCQILLRGDYNGILEPDVHYIPVEKDLSNIDEAIDKFKNSAYRNGIVENAYEHAITQHTYDLRVNQLIQHVLETHK
jgi:hypothetical protein